MYTGSCLCGRVQFRIEGELEQIQLCHCRQCRKAQGTPFATNAPVPSRAFHLLSGTEVLTEFESSPGKFRVFCSRCGSPIFSKRLTSPEVVRVRVGTLNEPLPIKPSEHFQ